MKICNHIIKNIDNSKIGNGEFKELTLFSAIFTYKYTLIFNNGSVIISLQSS